MGDITKIKYSSPSPSMIKNCIYTYLKFQEPTNPLTKYTKEKQKHEISYQERGINL